MILPRREFLVAVGSLAGGVGLAAKTERGHATALALDAVVQKITRGATVRSGKVNLDLPPLVENGNSVPLSVAVQSPMTAADHVKAIHVLAEKNPLPNVISVYLGPRSGRARIAARVRLADSQKILAIAELSDGSFWSDTKEVAVTLAACTESLI